MAKNKETLVIPDLHGQIEAAHFLVKYAKDKNMDMIFLGDLTDSFSKSKEEQRECIKLVLDALDDGHVCLWGNHDMSYLYSGYHSCSGWTYKKSQYFKELYEELRQHDNFAPYIFSEDYRILITHAGLSGYLVPPEHHGQPIKWLNQELDSEDLIAKSPLLKAGEIVGGSQPVGGITWLRPQKYKPLPHLRQIVGHTPQQGGVKKYFDSLWVTDTLEYGNGEVVKITTDGKIVSIPRSRYWK